MTKLFTKVLTPLFALSLIAGTLAPTLAQEGQPTLEIRVGTEGTMPPFTYHDENNRLTGFDIEVVRAIAETDPQLKITFQTGVWDTLFPGLDAEHIDMIANQIASTPERVERYLLTEHAYFSGDSQAIILKNQNSALHSLTDLKGKRVAVGVGTNHSRAIEDWNAAHGDPLNIVYYDGEVGLMFQDLLNYRVSAFINAPVVALEQAKIHNSEIAFLGEPIHRSPVHLIFKKSPKGEELQKRMDAGLEKIINNGRLKALTIEFFGQELVE